MVSSYIFNFSNFTWLIKAIKIFYDLKDTCNIYPGERRTNSESIHQKIRKSEYV